MLPLLPLLGYLIDTQCVIRGSIDKNATPLLPLEIIQNINQIILHYYLRWEELRVYRLVSGVLVRVKSEFTLTKVDFSQPKVGAL